MIEYCCRDFKRAMGEPDEIIRWDSIDNKYCLDGYDMVLDYMLNFCPFCGVKL